MSPDTKVKAHGNVVRKAGNVKMAIFSHSKLLFKAEDGSAIEFYMPPCEERKKLKPLIEVNIFSVKIIIMYRSRPILFNLNVSDNTVYSTYIHTTYIYLTSRYTIDIKYVY